MSRLKQMIVISDANKHITSCDFYRDVRITFALFEDTKNRPEGARKQ